MADDSGKSKANPFRILSFALLMLACVIAGVAGSAMLYGPDTEDAPYWWTGQGVTGTLNSINEKEAILTDTQGKSHSFEVNKFTRVISYGGRTLAPGEMVTVRYKEAGEKKIAKGVRGHAPKDVAADQSPSPAADLSPSPAADESPSDQQSPSPEPADE